MEKDLEKVEVIDHYRLAKAIGHLERASRSLLRAARTLIRGPRPYSDAESVLRIYRDVSRLAERVGRECRAGSEDSVPAAEDSGLGGSILDHVIRECQAGGGGSGGTD
jgi:hypothetical protein